MGTTSFLSAASSNGPRVCGLLFAVVAAQPALSLAQAQPDARSPGIVQLMNQIESLQAEINKLRGQIEVLSNGLDNAQKRQRDMYLDLDTRLRRIEQPAGDAARKEGQTPDLEERVKRLEQRAGADAAKGQDAQVSELEARVKRLEHQLAAASGNIPPPVVSAAPVPAPQAAPAASPPAPA
ncbi:MAG TPA: YbgF trimerization domain-containing protein, partial [Burkholderiales bacterium]|nr:YbgF trimerization domain-containing protein [Burkholderiales bacterium]